MGGRIRRKIRRRRSRRRREDVRGTNEKEGREDERVETARSQGRFRKGGGQLNGIPRPAGIDSCRVWSLNKWVAPLSLPLLKVISNRLLLLCGR